MPLRNEIHARSTGIRTRTSILGILRVMKRVVLLASLFVGGVAALPQGKPYPKPQIGSAAGQLAPDFTLKDQDGKTFRLADLRGHWVLLFFYRGYW